MKKFAWSSDLRTGMALIDEQHRQYSQFVNAFLRVCAKPEPRESDRQKAFSFLHAYARDHLQMEESLMTEYDYPARAAHVKKHDTFRSWIDEASRQVAGNDVSPEQMMHINYVLVDWFQEHIRMTDKLLTTYLDQVAHDRHDNKLLRLIRGVLGKR